MPDLVRLPGINEEMIQESVFTTPHRKEPRGKDIFHFWYV
jgi:hypothetical protein